MARLADIVIDCRRAASLARFWQAILDDYQIAPYDDSERRRLVALGIHDAEDDPTVLLEPSGTGPRIWFQSVPEPKVCKNRIHFDLRVDDLASEIARLELLGARQAESQPSGDVVVMLDPEANEFCLIVG